MRLSTHLNTINALLLKGVPHSEHQRIIECISNIDLPHSTSNSFWEPFTYAVKGQIARHVLYHDPRAPSKNGVVLLRYKHAAVAFHVHQGNEWVYVIEGYQETFNHQHYAQYQQEMLDSIVDDTYRYTADDGIQCSLPGTGHQVRSDHCLVLIYYERLPVFPD